MFFVDKEHEQNYENLVEYRFNLECSVACYIFALPKLWKKHQGNLGYLPID